MYSEEIFFSHFVWPPIAAFPFPYLHFPDVGNIGFLFSSELLTVMSSVTHIFLVLSVTGLVFIRMLRKLSQRVKE